MIMVLAWLPLKESVTLSGILTVALLALALRTSFWCYLSTGVAILMIWRGEAWKTVFLQSEQRVSELEQQLQKPISSTAGFSGLGSEFDCGGLHFPDLVHALSDRPLVSVAAHVHRPLPDNRYERGNLSGADLAPDRSCCGSLDTSQGEIIAYESKYHINGHPNTRRLYMTYIV
jgi:hypothetical protein